MSRAKGQKTAYKTPVDHLKAVIRGQETARVNRSVLKGLATVKRMIEKLENKYRGGGKK